MEQFGRCCRFNDCGVVAYDCICVLISGRVGGGNISRITGMIFFALSFALAIVFAGSPVSALFFLPKMDSVPHAGADLRISVNFSDISAPRMHFKNVEDNAWFVCDVSLADGSCTVPAFYLQEGLYEYYFANESGSSRFPEGNVTFRIALSLGNDLILGKARNLSDADPVSYCFPWSSDYSCNYENRQGSMVYGFSDAFYMTRNTTYGNHSLRFASNVISDDPGFYVTCDHSVLDFDCENENSNGPEPVQPSSTKRQASMINALWRLYNAGGNATVRGLALNYTNGSAENCDVWNAVPDYDCGNSDDQGMMIHSYFAAYEATGDVVYRGIAESLAGTGMNYNNSDLLLLGLLKAYELTGNGTYLEKAVNASLELIDSCRYVSCDAFNQSMSALASWKAYEMTGDYRYKLSAYDKVMHNFSGSCNPWNDTYRCQTPVAQGAIMQAFFKTYQALDSGGSRFYSPRMADVPERLKPLTINVSFAGVMGNPLINYRRLGKVWTTGNVSLTDKSYTIPAYDLSYPGVYEFYFYDNQSGARFPDDGGTVKFAVSDGNDVFKMIAQNFSVSNPMSLACRPLSGDFSCNYETYQGGMISGYSKSYFSSGTSLYKTIAENFAENEIDSTDSGTDPDWWATCDHTDGIFNCTTDSPGGGAIDVPAPRRQAWMIYSLWDAFQKTRNSSIKWTALNYTFGSSEMCDVWSATPDYDCENADYQGMMMLAYFKAYEQSGNDSFMRVAMNLSDVSLGMGSSDYLAMGLFAAYDMSGNATFYDRAINIINARLSDCVSSGCSPLDYSFSGLAAWSAYEHTGLLVYLDAAVNKTLSSPASGCDPWNATPDYRCTYPDEQGAMMSLYWTAYREYTIAGNLTNVSVALNVPSSIDSGNSFNAECIVENDGSDVVLNVSVGIYFGDGLNTSDNVTYFFDNLSVLENRTLNWTVTTIGSGDIFVSCNVTVDGEPFSDLGFVTLNDVIEEDEVSSSSSSGGVAAPTKLFYNESYNYSNMNGALEFFEMIANDSVFYDMLGERLLIDDNFSVMSNVSYEISKCYNVSRIFELNGSSSRIGLIIHYLCENTTLNLVVRDTIPKSFATSAKDVNVSLSKPGEVSVIEDDPSFMFVFDNATSGEVILVNYTVNKSITYNLLQYIDRPYLFGERFFENVSDSDSLQIVIIFPVNNSNMTSVVFDLVLGLYDESDLSKISCNYSMDTKDWEGMNVDLNMPSVMSAKISTSYGLHSITVECMDILNRTNSSYVFFNINREDIVDFDGGLLQPDEQEYFYFEGIPFILIVVVAGLFVYWCRYHLLALGSYVGLHLLLSVMYAFNKMGYVRYSLGFYPVLLRMYGYLDGIHGLKKFDGLERSIERVVKVLELDSFSNSAYAHVMKKDADMAKLMNWMGSIRKLYEYVAGESLAGVGFLSEVKRKYILCADYLSERM